MEVYHRTIFYVAQFCVPAAKKDNPDIERHIFFNATYCQLWGRPHNWQNGIAERFVLIARTDLLNHVIVFNEDHLRCLMREYVEYYNNDRCHLSLGRDSPLGRETQKRPFQSSRIFSVSKLGGLQHHYEWKQAT
jgi:integrase-like protein